MSDHPIHPATVHFPITFLTTAYGLDALVATWSYLPSAITTYLPTQTELSRISYYALSLGLLTALPAIFSGISQALPLLQRGLKNPDGTLKPKVKVLLAHAAVNDLVVIASGWIWWSRRQTGAAQLLLEGKNPVAYETGPALAAVGLLVAGALLFAAKLGGSLTYEHGMGLSIGKSTKKA